MSDTPAKVGKAPEGYRFTDVGLIPEDWMAMPLHKTCRGLHRGASPRPIEDPRWFDDRSTIGWVRISDVTQSRRYLLATSQRLSNEGIRRSRLVPRGSLIMSICATVGRPIETAIDACIHDGFVVFEHPDIDQGFLYHALCDLEPQWSQKGQTGSQMNLNTNLIKGTAIPVPLSEVEQRAIAETLSDVDGLIGALEKLIAKKRAIKQAAMQQLLTGQTRLPGFRGKWEAKRLGNHLKFLKNGVNSRAELSDDGGVRYLHYGDIHGSRSLFLNPSKAPMPCLPITKSEHLDRLENGDLIFADASEDLDGVGKAIEVQDVRDIELVSGLHTIAVRFDKALLADSFKTYLQFIPSFRAHLRQLAAGTKVYATNRAHIASAEVALPSVDEQNAIATVLYDIDANIEALEVRRDKTRQIKQGMMQQLLTGRIRLVKPSVAASEKAMTQTDSRRANVHFVRSVLAAEIIDQLHDQPTFGHVKFEKMMFLVEHLCEVDTGSTYHRKAAGPYDNRALRSIDSQLRVQQWFDARKEGKRYQYVPMQKRGGHKRYFDRYFSGIGETFDRILGAFKTLDTERCEIVATLLAAWSDLLRDGGTVSDQLIVHEVLNNWHEAKRRIPEDRWLKALGWMRSQGFVPKGTT